jgi:G3E family GTPase
MLVSLTPGFSHLCLTRLGSGSAFPATLAFQIRELERETERDLKLDAIVTVIDAENFCGYEDTSPTAKMQASYTDLILIVSYLLLGTGLNTYWRNALQNKWESVSEDQLDTVLDHLHTLNDTTPKVKCKGKEGVDPQLLFGLDSKLFLNEAEFIRQPSHNDEVETVTLRRGGKHMSHEHSESCGCGTDLNEGETGADDHHDHETRRSTSISQDQMENALAKVSPESVWRIKGFVQVDGMGECILNWAFGRHELTVLKDAEGGGVLDPGETVRLTVMGERGEVKRRVSGLASQLGSRIDT